MPNKTKINPAIARVVLRDSGAGRKQIIVTLGKPRRVAAGDWACSYRIHGIRSSSVYDAHGFDAVQALVLAIESVRIALDQTGRQFSCLGGEPGDAGFPRYVPTAFGPEFAKRLGRLIDREVDRFARAVEKRHRARRSARLRMRGR